MPPPYLKRVWLDPHAEVDRDHFPFSLPLFRPDFELRFDRAVTILVGENGTGKSTLLEGIAVLAGFPEMGGGPGYRTDTAERVLAKEGGRLVPTLRGSWLPRVVDNTLQQFALFLAGSLALAASLSPERVTVIGAVAITFTVCRILFWIGYRIDPLYRAFGFSSTAYLNLALLLAALWYAVA